MEHVVTTERKPPGRALHVIAAVQVRTGQRVQVSERTRAEIEEMAAALWAASEPAEISRVIARRLGVREAVVDVVVAGLMIQYRTEAAAMRAILSNAAGMAAEAGEQVWEDVA